MTTSRVKRRKHEAARQRPGDASLSRPAFAALVASFVVAFAGTFTGQSAAVGVAALGAALSLGGSALGVILATRATRAQTEEIRAKQAELDRELRRAVRTLRRSRQQPNVSLPALPSVLALQKQLVDSGAIRDEDDDREDISA